MPAWITLPCAVLLLLLCRETQGYNNFEECENYRANQILYSTDSQSLVELHIRHNLQVKKRPLLSPFLPSFASSRSRVQCNQYFTSPAPTFGFCCLKCD
jgi:hypothetical protein